MVFSKPWNKSVKIVCSKAVNKLDNMVVHFQSSNERRMTRKIKLMLRIQSLKMQVTAAEEILEFISCSISSEL